MICSEVFHYYDPSTQCQQIYACLMLVQFGSLIAHPKRIKAIHGRSLHQKTAKSCLGLLLREANFIRICPLNGLVVWDMPRGS